MLRPKTLGTSQSREAGQAMAEYIILVCALFIGLVPVMGALQRSFENYYAFVATWISLPVP